MKKTAKLTALFMALLLLVSCGPEREESRSRTDAEKKAEETEENLCIAAKDIDVELVDFFAYNMISQYAAYGYDETTIKDLLAEEQDGVTVEKKTKDEIIKAYKQFMAVEIIAEKEGISLTVKELKEIKDEKNEQISQAGGKDEFIEQLDASHLSEELFDEIQKNIALQDKLFNELYSEDGSLAPSEDEIIDNAIESFEGAARSKHILIQATQGSADYAEKQALANEALARAVAGEDFDALIEQYGEDPGMSSNPNGYVFYEDGMLLDGSSSFIPEFVKGTFAVQPGMVNPALVPSSYGFHIIKRLPLDEEYARANLSEYLSTYAYNLFSEYIDAVAASIEFETTKHFDELDLASFLIQE